MGTVIFDFDSTLITIESLDEIIAKKNGDVSHQIKNITRAGMEGRLSFRDSLQKRLAIARPTLDEIASFGKKARQLVTPGMAPLVEKLHAKGHQVRIVSGGMYEAIVPVAISLGVPPDRVHAVRLLWDEQRQFSGIDSKDLFSISKTAGLKKLAGSWPSPKVAVGDGMTDYRLFRNRLVDHFIIFTQNARRRAVIDTGAPEARNAQELTQLLEAWL